MPQGSQQVLWGETPDPQLQSKLMNTAWLSRKNFLYFFTHLDEAKGKNNLFLY
jgi:hypothetical protein